MRLPAVGLSLRAGVVACALAWAPAAYASDHTYAPADIAQAWQQGASPETLDEMIESRRWNLSEDWIIWLLHQGVPPAVVIRMVGPDGPSLEAMRIVANDPAVTLDAIQGCSCQLETLAGESVRGEVIAATTTEAVVLLADDSVRALPRGSVIRATRTHPSAADLAGRIGRLTTFLLLDGSTVEGTLVAVDAEKAVLAAGPEARTEVPLGGIDRLIRRPAPGAQRQDDEGEADLMDQVEVADGEPNPGKVPAMLQAKRGLVSARVGLTLTSVGVLATLIDALNGQRAWHYAGLGMEGVGASLAAGGSLRAAHGMSLMGRRVSPVAGYVGWALCGVAGGVAAASYDEPDGFGIAGTGVVMLGSMLSSALQMAADEAAIRGHHWNAGVEPGSGPVLVLVPTGNGVALVGEF